MDLGCEWGTVGSEVGGDPTLGLLALGGEEVWRLLGLSTPDWRRGSSSARSNKESQGHWGMQDSTADPL